MFGSNVACSGNESSGIATERRTVASVGTAFTPAFIKIRNETVDILAVDFDGWPSLSHDPPEKLVRDSQTA